MHAMRHRWSFCRCVDPDSGVLHYMTRLPVRWAVVACAALVVSAAAHTPALADPLRAQPPESSTQPQAEGTNDWNCVPSEQHPRPVVLIHGTGMNSTAWSVLAPELRDIGYCVFALNYGAVPALFDPSTMAWGTGDILASSRELASFVQEVRDATGAAQVDLVGHSQGGPLARQYLKFDGGANSENPAQNIVHSVVSLGATNHGTTFGGIQSLTQGLESVGLPGRLIIQILLGRASVQQLVGSPVLASLNAGSEVEPGVNYTAIATRTDAVSTPPEGAFLANDGSANVHNEWVQDKCPQASTSHDGLITDPVPLSMVKAALDPAWGEDNPIIC